MDVIFWFGFVGAWLLFAGPVYQAAIELREEGFDADEVDELHQRVAALGHPPHISRWWWLLPPVAYVLSRRQARAWRARSAEMLTTAQREKFLSFQNKAAGWLIVAGGALCIAIKETTELVEHHEWPWWVLAIALFVPFLMSVGYTVNRVGRHAVSESAPRP